jgi:hypothetical protein
MLIFRVAKKYMSIRKSYLFHLRTISRADKTARQYVLVSVAH